MSVPPPLETPENGSGRRKLPRFFLHSTGTSPTSSPLDMNASTSRIERQDRDQRPKGPSFFLEQSPNHTSPSLPSSPSSSRRPSRFNMEPNTPAYRLPSSVEYFPRVVDMDNSDISPLIPPLTDGQYIDACLELHRILYRGRNDISTSTSWREQVPLIQRVVDQFFDTDCKYDHPLVNVTSRQSVITHFILFRLVSTGYIPHLSPSNLVQVISNLTLDLRYHLLGYDVRERNRDIESSPIDLVNTNGKGKLIDPKWNVGSEMFEKDKDQSRWWRLWDVSANCTDIGNLHTQNGNHFTLIEHVVTLTLFPALMSRHADQSRPNNHTASTTSLSSIDEPARGSFTERLLGAIVKELDYVLRWDLPISTMVRFNENGKATQIRDRVDIRDLISTFVPLAGRLGRLIRRSTGLATSALGTFALSASAPPAEVKTDRGRLASPIGLAVRIPDSVSSSHPQPYQSSRCDDNSLGLQGIALESRNPFS